MIIKKMTYSPIDNFGISSNTKMKSQYHTWLEKIERYSKDIDIEVKAFYDMIISQVIPMGIKYQKELVESISRSTSGAGEMDCVNLSMYKDLLIGLTMLLSSIRAGSNTLKNAYERNVSGKDRNGNTDYYSKELKTEINRIKEDIDSFEALIAYKLN